LPVVRINLKRFSSMVGSDRKRILERLPYVGLDIESVDSGSVRVEYSPNRPDLGTDFGIARALRGLLGRETGLPKFHVSPSGVTMAVDHRLSKVRPFIACVSATGLRLDDEDIRQVVSLQEDLHNGLGRKRKTVAVGLHDMDAIKPPFSYHAVDSSFKFVPLGGKHPVTVGSILAGTKEGRAYGGSLAQGKAFPMITDSNGVVLSFPPIINGDATKVTSKTENIFVDVTSTDQKAGDDVLAVIATTLAAAGGKLGSVRIGYPRRPRVTPDLAPTELPLDEGLVRSLIGLDLTHRQIVDALSRSRLGVRGFKALGPRYRVDLLHPVDVAEEAALGYGVDKIGPIYPPSNEPGAFNSFEDFLDSASTVMAGAGMIELMTFELTDENSLFSNFQRPSASKVTVQNPKSADHSILRDALIPSLMASLSGNVKSDYPQRVFEIGKVYSRSDDGVREAWHLGCLIAHTNASYTEAKMFMESACEIIAGKEVATSETTHWAFTPGRSALARAAGSQLGHVGEIKPEAIEAFSLGVPVSGFELDLSKLFELLK
jgi:phenylalanyl-tRNA synthetase beta chain